MPNLLSSAPASSQDLNSARSGETIQTLRSAQKLGTNSKKIDDAARSFESLLVGHWLEQAEKSFASVPGTDKDQQNDSSRDQFLSIACESLAQGLSRKGGFGIAAMISKSLEAGSEADKKPEIRDADAAEAHVLQPQQHQVVDTDSGISGRGH